MSVDWSKPIEALEKATDRVVTVSYDGREWSEYEKRWMYRTKEVVAGNTNQNWYEDGRDWCNCNAWFVRNCVEEVLPIDWEKPLELEDGTPVRIIRRNEACDSGYTYYTLQRCDGHPFTDEQAEGFQSACWELDGQRCYRPFEGGRATGIRVRNRVEQSPTIPVPTITFTGLPVPQGFADVMKHTIVGADITGILITAGDRMEITTTPGATFVVSISTK